MRLRQAVLAARELEPVAAQLRSALALREPFRDEGVGLFGLANNVFALGHCFIEIVSPVQAGTTAARYLDRRGGDCGYMVIFDLEDLEGARSRARALGVRAVWEIDLPDISTTHLHPADMHGAIVSIDRSNPYGSWRWGGPQWTPLGRHQGAAAEGAAGTESAAEGAAAEGAAGTGTVKLWNCETVEHSAAGRLAGVTIAVANPRNTAARWGEVLGIAVSASSAAADEAAADDVPVLELDDGEVRFVVAAHERAQGLVEIAVELPHELPGGAAMQIGGVCLRRVGAGEGPRRVDAGEG